MYPLLVLEIDSCNRYVSLRNWKWNWIGIIVFNWTFRFSIVFDFSWLSNIRFRMFFIIENLNHHHCCFRKEFIYLLIKNKLEIFSWLSFHNLVNILNRKYQFLPKKNLTLISLLRTKCSSFGSCRISFDEIFIIFCFTRIRHNKKLKYKTKSFSLSFLLSRDFK